VRKASGFNITTVLLFVIFFMVEVLFFGWKCILKVQDVIEEKELARP
jgi:hypothetical protein